jgi:hypothetical protein
MAENGVYVPRQSDSWAKIWGTDQAGPRFFNELAEMAQEVVDPVIIGSAPL